MTVRVLVDLLFLTGGKGGMESYVERLYGAIAPPPGVEFVGLASKESADRGLHWFPGDVIDSGVSGEDRVAWALGELRALPSWVRRTGAALVHSPANVGPARASVPVVLTVHDVLPFVHPEWVPGRHGAPLRWLVRRAARNAARVLTVSRSSAEAIAGALRIPADRIVPIPLAGEPSAAPETLPPPGRPMVLSIGNRMPHKNVEILLHALALIPPGRRPRLAFTGGGEGDPLPALAARLGLQPDVDLLGWLSPDELDAAFARSAAIAFPTRFEGFGLPVLEAMSRGRAVICSDLPVLHEVGGEAAVYVDPDDAGAWARAIDAVANDRTRLDRLGALGAAHARTFSWERTAERTFDVFQSVLAGSQRAAR
ncbi:glycosyltransferase family 4 protein [Leifsonia sp. L25]|uniref:glycosyltransferase family 4 protein n=1 Tax=Actinomycetes TaxID=1760 RepID=UPI003D69672B